MKLDVTLEAGGSLTITPNPAQINDNEELKLYVMLGPGVSGNGNMYSFSFNFGVFSPLSKESGTGMLGSESPVGQCTNANIETLPYTLKIIYNGLEFNNSNNTADLKFNFSS